MLAIVIPYFKLTFFEETLQSLANQTDKRFKVYIGNDASLENPENLLNGFKNKFNFYYKRFNENLGGKSLVMQWERCIELTNNEEWLMLLGDDDVLANNIVEEFYNGIKKDFDFNVMRFSTIIIKETSTILSSLNNNPIKESPIKSYYRKVTKETRSSLSEYIFKKTNYNKKGFYPYPLAWCSDDRAWIDFSEGKDIYSTNKAKVKIRISQLSLTGSKKNKDKKYTTEIRFKKWFYYNFNTQLNKNEKLNFLYELENYIKKYRQIKYKEMFFLFKEYLKNFNLIPFIKLIRRILLRFYYGK